MSKFLPIVFLISCCAQKPTTTITTRLYQADQIFLEAGKPINTRDGVYIPQNLEIFYSADKLERLEKQLGSFK